MSPYRIPRYRVSPRRGESKETFDARVRVSVFPNFPVGMAGDWFYSHTTGGWQHAVDYQLWRREIVELTVLRENLPLADCQDQLAGNIRLYMKDEQRRSDRLLDVYNYLLTHGTWPVPPTFADLTSPLIFPLHCYNAFKQGGSPWRLLEGHHRVGCFWFAKESGIPLKEEHRIWMVR